MDGQAAQAVRTPWDKSWSKMARHHRSQASPGRSCNIIVVAALSPKTRLRPNRIPNGTSLMNEMPDDQVFVLPILSEKCDVPSLRVGQIDLLELQWEEVKQADIPAFVDRLVASKVGTP